MNMRIYISLLILLSFGIVGCARTVPIDNPSFTILSDSSAHTATAIKKALQGRDWALLKDSPGRIVAQYSRNAELSATVQIDYKKDSVSIKYVESSNLSHGLDSKGQEIIHKAYMKWVANLKKDIQINAGYK